MSVYSMTGYASGQSSNAGAPAEPDAKTSAPTQIGLEIRAVNSRFLDLAFRLPDELRPHEAALREKLVARLKRGKVEVRISIDSDAQASIVEPSLRLLQRLGAVQDAVRSWMPAAPALSVAEILRMASTDQPRSLEAQTELMPLFDRTLTALLESREREGERLASMLGDRVSQLRSLAQQATPLVPRLVEQQRNRFLERWTEAMALGDGAIPSEAARDRALTEATTFAIRIDVAEEITRLDSHLVEIDRLINKGGEIGKRLDFLIQELHREANTLGSKSSTLEMTRISVDMKVLIEQMREQVQNIE